MPTAAEILADLTRIANDRMTLAILWHVYFTVLAGLMFFRRVKSCRLAGFLLTLPMFSVGLLNWSAGVLLNGVAFITGGIVMTIISLSLGRDAPAKPGPVEAGIGTVVFVFGWAYPHFLETDSFLPYFWAAPLGLLPGPTLGMIIALTMMTGGLNSIAWRAVLGGLGLLYGVIGTAWLGVNIDGVLIAGALFVLLSLAEAWFEEDETED